MPEVSITRPAAPSVEDYSVVPGSLGPRRDFRISVGWDADGRVFDVTEAVRTARAWIARMEAGQAALSGMFTRAEVTYAWPRPDGTVGSDRDRWHCSLAKLSTPILVICPTRQSRRC